MPKCDPLYCPLMVSTSGRRMVAQFSKVFSVTYTDWHLRHWPPNARLTSGSFNAVFLSSSLGATVLSGKLYAIGGYGETGPMTSTERFDFKSEKWSILKSLVGPRFHHGVVSLGGKIFVVGGRDNDYSKDTVEVYDPKEKGWKLLDEKMNEARNDFGIVCQGKSIYCVGGRGVSSVEFYSLAKKEWRVAGRVGQNNFCISCVSFPPF